MMQGVTRQVHHRQVGPYVLEQELRRGLNSTVYQAWNARENRYYALKEVSLSQDPRQLAAFRREIELLRQLPAHPNLVRIHDVLNHENQVFLSMDYVEGKTLAEKVREQAVEPILLLKLLREVCSALKVVHGAGVVHCDISLSNILVGTDGVAVVADFGAAVTSFQGIDNFVQGTPKYCAPERLTLPNQVVNPVSDLYSLGICAYEAALGTDRFRRVTREIIQEAATVGEVQAWLNWQVDRTRQFPPLDALLDDLSPRLVQLIDNLLIKDPGLRLQTAEAALRAIEEIEKSESAQWIESGSLQINQEVSPPTVPAPSEKTGWFLNKTPFWVQKWVRKVGSKFDLFQIWDRVRGGLVLTMGLLLFGLCAGAWLVRGQITGFQVIIQGAPPTSRVFLDDVERTLPNQQGLLRLMFVRPGTRNIRVSCTGYQDFHAAVSGRDGEEQTLVAVMKPEITPASFPQQINYTGNMMLIAAGEFIMGDDHGHSNEKPAYTVDLPDFYLDRYEVTNRQYKVFCDAVGRKYPTDPWWSPGYFHSKPDFPVVGVGFDDAKAYADWCGKRLPTESEWEKAASWSPTQPEKRTFPWGNDPVPNNCNMKGTDLVAVGSYATSASAYGIEDLAGNAAEWTDGLYAPYPGNSVPDPGYSSGSRSVRGGSFRSEFFDVRTTRRFYRPEQFSETEQKERGWIIGFRCAVSADDPRLQDFLKKGEIKPIPGVELGLTSPRY